MCRRILRFVLLAALLAGCAESTGINPRGWHFLSAYNDAPDYKVLVVTPSGRNDAYSMAIGQDRESVRAAIDEAMQICEEGRAEVRAAPECRLHSVGDTDVRGMDDMELAAAIAQYKAEAIPAVGGTRPVPPGEAANLVNSGAALVRVGNDDRAIEDFTEAIRLAPGYTRAYRSRADAYHRLGDYDKAIRDFDVAIRLEPKYARAYVGRGSAYEQLGDYDNAIRDYTEAIRREPEYARAYNNRCRTYGRKRRAKQALKDCNKSLRLRPDNAATLDNRALAYWLLGEHEKARQDLQRVRELRPETPPWQERFRQFEAMF